MGNKGKKDVKKDLQGEELTGFDRVIRKLQESEKYAKVLSKDEKEQFALILTNVDELKRTYLNTKWTETLKILEISTNKDTTKKPSEAPEESSESKKEESGKTKSKPLNFSSKSEEDDETVDFGDEITEEDMKMDMKRIEEELEKQIKVKLVITDIMDTSVKKAASKIISPVISTFNFGPTFGMFHTALLIGPWMIDWNDSALCVPRKCTSKAAIFTADIGELATKTEVQDIVDSLAEVIVKWNSTMEYTSGLEKKKSKEGNCQAFIDDVLEELDIKPEFDGAMGAFIKKIKTHGFSEMIYEVTNEQVFRKCPNIKKSNKFKTHKELDEFVQGLLDSCETFATDFPGDWSLLKSFDRSFWLRYRAFKNKKHSEKKKMYQPLTDDLNACKCPFDDPEVTGSIINE